MQEFEQLMILDDSSIDTERKREFVQLHKDIMYNGNMAADYAVKLAQCLRRMKDEKLYLEAGFESFGCYAEQACGIKERQAYTYISVLDNLPDDFLQLNAKLGITKLGLLTQLDKQDITVIQDSVDLESVTVKQLQAEIDSIKAENAERCKQLEMDLSSLITEKEHLQEQIASAETIRLPEPQVVTVVDEKTQAELERAQEKLEKFKQEKLQKEQELEKVKQANEQAISKAVEQERQAVKKLEIALQVEREKVEIAEKKAKMANTQVAEFKMLFTVWQEQGNKLKGLIKEMDEQDAVKCKRAIQAVAEVLNND